MKKQGKGAALWGAALALMTVLALLTGIILYFATSAGEYEAAMTRFAPPTSTGLAAEEYAPLAAHIADYLAGRKDDFQYMLPGTDGTESPAFHDYELIHMADVRNLIRLDRRVCVLALGLAAVSLGALLCAGREGRKPAYKGAVTALRVLGIFAAGMVLWAVINFDGLFITFHKVAFRNDYWLLDPRTDLLIRLMPEEMFIHLGLKGLAFFAIGMLLLLIGLLAAGKKIKKGTASL